MAKTATASVLLVVLAIVALAACNKDSTSDGQALGDPTARAESSDSSGSDDAQWLFAVQARATRPTMLPLVVGLMTVAEQVGGGRDRAEHLLRLAFGGVRTTA